MNSKKEVGKIIRGVVYDDYDHELMCDAIMSNINTCANHIKHGDPETTKSLESLDTDYETFRDYTNGMGAIAALTRYNFETGVHHNLIIPKEALSLNLVKELENVDLGKDIYDNYTEHFLRNRGILEDEEPVEPEDFCDSEEEDLLSHLDNATFILNDKKVSKEEFFKDPVALETINSLINGTFFKNFKNKKAF